MPLGPLLRRALGSLEEPVAGAYRSFFFDLEVLSEEIARWIEPCRILEVGCGEGQLTKVLCRRFPQARITGIDVAPGVGRLCTVADERVEFRRQELADFAAEHPRRFDLVVVCDVLHHVPWEHHRRFLADARRTLAPGGGFVLKEWERRRSLAHLLAWVSDRYVTGDRVRFARAEELRGLIVDAFGPSAVEREVRLPPRCNNLAFLVRPQPIAGGGPPPGDQGSGPDPGGEGEGPSRQ